MLVIDILSLDGVVVRKIPLETVSYWSSWGMTVFKLMSNEKIVRDINGKILIQKIKKNLLAGYVVTFDKSQGSNVLFNKKTSGFGQTIVEAYKDGAIKAMINL